MYIFLDILTFHPEPRLVRARQKMHFERLPKPSTKPALESSFGLFSGPAGGGALRDTLEN